MGNNGLILPSQYMTPLLLVCSILDIILMNVANFLGHYNSILLRNISYSCGNTINSSLLAYWCKYVDSIGITSSGVQVQQISM